MRKFMMTAAVAAALLIAAPFAAQAVEGDASPDPSASSTAVPNEYPPNEPTEPSLAGSSVVPACSQDVPWIEYKVELTDPNALATSHTARLVLSDGTNSEPLLLGELVDNKLEGRILWPGATVGDDGRGNGWPGWTQNASGEWIETNGNFAWTRGNITATIEVNPSISVALSYPPSTPQCLTGPPRSGGGAGSLPATGMSAYVVPLGVAGGIAAIAGVVLLVSRRRTQG